MKRFLLLCSLLACFAASASAQKKPAPKPKPKAPAANADLAASITRGKQVYTQVCLSCHQADGGGVQNMNPPLIKTTYVLGDKTRLVKVLLNGLQDVDVDGEPYSNVMPAQVDLTDQQIADVLTYVRNSFGNKAVAVKAPEVKAIRAANKK
ncbi:MULTISPECIES: c-type cytochrome [Hymenobacter]|uniref:Cytochrome c n=1 Tax=Hymenobacter jejuensis TaxID=2502781 RepID=A0A5B7ZU48_9BACT|nr:MULTISPECIES: cytochrome c [Hymenobacter]MBC6989089.1 cytochrome c [Hymenobacter sp. BT491]QDA58701.1 cytochrome c [Hymenobacter jejuensis]